MSQKKEKEAQTNLWKEWAERAGKTQQDLRAEFIQIYRAEEDDEYLKIWEQAVELWGHYYISTELYDRHLVSFSGGGYFHGSAIPSDKGSSNVHAKYRLGILNHKARELGIDAAILRDAKKYVARLSFGDIWRLVMGYEPCPRSGE